MTPGKTFFLQRVSRRKRRRQISTQSARVGFRPNDDWEHAQIGVKSSRSTQIEVGAHHSNTRDERVGSETRDSTDGTRLERTLSPHSVLQTCIDTQRKTAARAVRTDSEGNKVTQTTPSLRRPPDKAMVRDVVFDAGFYPGRTDGRVYLTTDDI